VVSAAAPPVPEPDAGTAVSDPVLEAIRQARSPAEVAVLLRIERCQRDVRCGTIGASQREECLKDDSEARWDETAMSSGHLRFDAERSVRCVSQWRAQTCHEAPIDLPPACRMLPTRVWVTPTALPGQKCRRFDECVDGFCSKTGCEGVCVARTKRGGHCDANQICLDEDYCEDETCRPRGRAGDACSGHWQGCEEGSFCEGWVPANDNPHDWSPGEPGRCAAPKKEGEACKSDLMSGICQHRFFCNWGEDPPVCRKPLAAGSECRWLDACGDGLACTGFRFGGTNPASTRKYGVAESGRCQPFLDAGAACDPSVSVTGCPSSMRCNPKTRRCELYGRPGDACDSSWCPPDAKDCHPVVCLSSAYCDPKTQRCAKKRALGESCVPAVLGRDDEPCEDSVCDPKTRRCVERCN
jgi:hypothetical protein